MKAIWSNDTAAAVKTEDTGGSESDEDDAEEADEKTDLGNKSEDEEGGEPKAAEKKISDLEVRAFAWFERNIG